MGGRVTTSLVDNSSEAPTGVFPSRIGLGARAEEDADATNSIPRLLAPHFIEGARRALLAAPAFVLGTGTIDASVLGPVDISGAREVYESQARHSDAAESEPDVVSQLLSTIRTAFGGSIAELATMLRVRRPTIYAWMDGTSSPQRKNRARLDGVATVAKYWIRKGRGSASEFFASRPADAARLRELLVGEELLLDAVLELIDDLVMMPQHDTSVEAMIRRHSLRMPSEEERRERLDRETGKRISGE
jgi:hypothetical protein